jgi:queuine tRNA-ribosyltransferase subunit QTRTD1
MPLEFKIQETGTFERCGTIQLAKRTIHTPVCLTYSLHGSVPHLVADNLKHLPVHLVHIFLEQL